MVTAKLTSILFHTYSFLAAYTVLCVNQILQQIIKGRFHELQPYRDGNVCVPP